MPIDLGSAVATIKAVAGVAKAAGKIDLYNDIIELQQTVLELLAENTRNVENVARLTQDAAALRDTVAQLKASIAARHEMVFETKHIGDLLKEGSVTVRFARSASTETAKLPV